MEKAIGGLVSAGVSASTLLDAEGVDPVDGPEGPVKRSIDSGMSEPWLTEVMSCV